MHMIRSMRPMVPGSRVARAASPVPDNRPMTPIDESFSVSVRALCDFTARRGDLDLALRPSSTAAEGLAIHRRVAEQADPDRRHEVAVAADLDGLRVRGRIDAVDDARGLIEEVKSYRGARERIPAMRIALHWAQAESYAALYALAQQPRPARIEVALRQIEVDSGAETVQVRACETAALVAELRARAATLAAWLAQESAHRRARDAALARLSFPLGAFRSGQRELAAAVYRACARRRQLLAGAPTGLGKSIAAVFGALKGMHAASLDKLLLLTCRTTGAHGLLRALEQCNGQDGGLDAKGTRVGRLRILELGSRERACQRPGRQCTPQDCDLARGFHDKLPAARAAAVAGGLGSIATLARFSDSHALCPYHLAHECVAWADVVVADVNHWFDRHAGLQSQVQAEGWKVAVVVDEAHNLVERARSMYTQALTAGALGRLAKRLPQVPALGVLARSWRRMESAFPLDYQEIVLPAAFARRIDDAASALAAVIADLPARSPQLLADDHDTAWALLALRSLIDEAGDGDLIELLREDATSSTLRVRCVVPSAHLVGAWSAAAGTTLMSATLAPFEYHRQMLGMAPDAFEFACESPWQGQLQVVVRTDISTRWRDREGSAARIAELVHEVIKARPGNYMVFASSYAYLQLLHEQIVAGASVTNAPSRSIRARSDPVPDVAPLATWMQTARMSDAQKSAYLERFTTDGVGIGFAVLGGGFGEGIDLIGSRLSGAFIATLGLPQVDEPNEVSRRLIEARFGDGWKHNYLIPGLTRVGQAGGRIVRSASDRGVLYLLDDRYALREVREALPDWWFASSGSRSPASRRSQH